MTPADAVRPDSVPPAKTRSAFAGAIKAGWEAGRRPDALAALARHPDLAADRAVVLDLAYEEFCLRQEAGEVVDPDAFCARFPFATSLRRLLAVHQFLDRHPDALAAPPASWPELGNRLGEYLVVRELGRGGFSRVYLGLETTAGDRPVAAKVSAAGSTEADTLAPLSHPHLIPVLSARTVGEWSVVAMPFLGTATLEDVLSDARAGVPRSAKAILASAGRGRLEEDPPPSSQPVFPLSAGMRYADGVAAVAAGVVAAVAYLHGRGLAHRDLKPSNVLLGPTGYPYLLDFNLAARVTDPGRLAGTLPYMAPEQLAAATDPATPLPGDGRPGDVYAVGVMLFELLTGRHPYPAAGAEEPERFAAALAAAQRTGAPPLARLNPQVPRRLRAAVERCLAVDPATRPTAAELSALLARRRPGSWRRWLLPAAVGVGVYLVSQASQPAHPSAPPSDPVPADPPPPAGAFERGLTLYRQGQIGLAATEFLAAGEAGQDGRAYAYATYCLAARRDQRTAILAADRAIALGARTPAVLATRAYARLLTGRLREAVEDCDAALELDPDLRAARLTRADARLQLHRRDGEAVPPEALADIERVTAGSPNTPDVWLTAAHLHLAVRGDGAKDPAGAAVYAAVQAGKPPDALRRNPALTAALAGHPAFEAALRLTPGTPPAGPDPHLATPAP